MYFYIISILLFFSLILSFNGKKESNIVLLNMLNITVVVLLFLLMGTRLEHVGTDTPAYYKIFYLIEYSSDVWGLRYEPGFIFVSKFLSGLNFSPESLILVCSALIVFPISYFIYSVSPLASISILLYVGVSGFFFAFNGVRQAISEAFILLSMMYFIRDDSFNKRSGFLLLLAPLFHYASMIFIPTYFLLGYSRRFWIYSLSVTYVISLFFIMIPSAFSMLSSVLFYLVPSTFDSYTRNASFVGDYGFVTFFYQVCFVICFAALIYTKNKAWSKYLVLAMIGIILSNFFTYSGFLNRMPRYWLLFLIVAIPIAISTLFNGYQKLLVGFSFFAIAIVFLFRAIAVSSNNVFPYASWFLG